MPATSRSGPDPSQLSYGVSVTDACIDWETTETLLTDMAETLRPIVAARKQS